jgi:hypothetical protein
VLSPLQSPDAAEPREDLLAPPPALEKHAPWRRWGISIAVALLLHAVIAVSVFLAWWQPATLSPPGPVIVEFAPPPGQQSAQSAEPTFATTRADAGRSKSTEHADIDHPFAQFTPKSEVAEVPTDPTFAAQSRELIAPAGRTNENAADVRTASGGSGVLTAPNAELSGPIDTRIAPFSGSRAFDPRAKKAPRKLAQSLSPLVRQNKQAGGQGLARRLSALPSSIVINAIGARVQDRVSAAIARANASGNGTRNAVGSTVGGNAGSTSANATDSVVTNAIGIAVHVRPNIPRPLGSELGTSTTTSVGGWPSMNPSIINGTAIGRPGSNTAIIGGPKKNVAGVIDGNSFRTRR